MLHFNKENPSVYSKQQISLMRRRWFTLNEIVTRKIYNVLKEVKLQIEQ